MMGLIAALARLLAGGPTPSQEILRSILYLGPAAFLKHISALWIASYGTNSKAVFQV
jgi:hypothetical protein